MEINNGNRNKNIFFAYLRSGAAMKLHYDLRGKTMHQEIRLRRKKWVSEQTCLSFSTIERGIKSGRFPRPIKIGLRAIAWRELDILEWMQTREESIGQHQ